MEQESGLRALNLNQLHFDLLILNPIYKLLLSNVDYDLFLKNMRGGGRGGRKNTENISLPNKYLTCFVLIYNWLIIQSSHTIHKT